jgi:co-chaperonin GroES (HSP10)
MRIPKNYLIIKVTSTLNDTIETNSGITLYRPLDVGFVDQFRKTEGIAEILPEAFSPRVITKCPASNGKDLRKHDEFSKVIQAGDKVHFSYLSTMPNNRVSGLPGYSEKDLLFRIPYDDVHAYERDGELYANVGRLILEPIDEKLMKSTMLIIPETMRRKSAKLARVLSVGRPWKGEGAFPAKKGDIVMYNKKEGDWFGPENKWLAVYNQFIDAIIPDKVLN